MKRRDFLAMVGAGMAGAVLGGGPATAQPHHPVSPMARPNIVFILADDLGFEALGAYGALRTKEMDAAVKTPNLDAMAAGGMRFTQCFSTPVCSPARAEFLTGRYNCRTGFTDIAGRNGAVTSLDARAFPTLPAVLKQAGYVTAVSGKWHLGEPSQILNQLPDRSLEDSRSEHVRSCGFDRQYVFGGAHLRAYGEPKAGEYTPEWFQAWTLRFIESRKDKPEPFFLYYPSPIPHFPLLPTPLNPGGGKGEPANAKIGGTVGANENYPFLIEYLDRQVGELLSRLDELGLRRNTLVMFAGDNGTNKFTTEMRDGKSVLGGKGSMKDTGAWVPLLASWPGRVPAGAVCERLVDFTDLMPTLLELAGAAETPAGLDGISFAGQLQGGPGNERPWVHVHYVNHYFVRDKKWKLHEDGTLVDISGSPYEEKTVSPESESAEAKAARKRLQEVLDTLHPEGPPKAAGKEKAGKQKKGGKNKGKKAAGI